MGKKDDETLLSAGVEFEDQSDKCGCPRILVHLSLLMK